MVTVNNHYKMSLYGCMFAAMSYLLGKREAQPQMPKNLPWKPCMHPGHSRGALDKSLAQVTHYLDKIHASPSEPITPYRRASLPMLHPSRDAKRWAPEDIPFLAGEQVNP